MFRELIVRAAGERVGQRNLRASSGFIDKGHWREISILPVDGIGARPAVAQKTIAAVERQWAALLTRVPSKVGVSGSSPAKRQRCALPSFRFFFEHDVDDAGNSFGVI